MKPPMDEVRLDYAVDLLNKELDASKHEIRQALTNEAHFYRNEGHLLEDADPIRVNDLE